MKLLTVTPRSATLELSLSRTPYYHDKPFEIRLNGEILRSESRNVFSVFGLEPCTYYSVEAADERIVFSTPEEDCFVSVKDFNAAGDGRRDDTGAFTAAICCLPEKSTLFVPQGDYFLKPVFLKSGITLYLDKGARILACPDRKEYPVLPAKIEGKISRKNLGTWQGEEAECFASVFTAVEQSDISIIGEGEIDCLAESGDWYVNHRVKRTAWRPRGIFFNRCKNVLMQGVTVKNTPSWNIHPYFCENVKLYNLSLLNPPEMPTTDGIDPDSCNGVEIAGVDISVGDDCIAIKSGTLETAKYYKTPCKNVEIRNCLMRDGHGGVVFGSELSGGIEDIKVTQCLFCGTERGLRIKTRRGRGRVGKCDGIEFSHIKMENVKVPFVVNMYYNMGDENGHSEYVWTTEKLPVDERTPEVGAFTFKNMTCTGVEYCAGAFYGLPESPVKSVTFENVSFSYNNDCEAGFPDMREKNEAVKNIGLDMRYVGKVTLKNVKFEGQSGDEVLLQSVEKYKRS